MYLQLPKQGEHLRPIKYGVIQILFQPQVTTEHTTGYGSHCRNIMDAFQMSETRMYDEQIPYRSKTIFRISIIPVIVKASGERARTRKILKCQFRVFRSDKNFNRRETHAFHGMRAKEIGTRPRQTRQGVGNGDQKKIVASPLTSIVMRPNGSLSAAMSKNTLGRLILAVGGFDFVEYKRNEARPPAYE